MKHTLMRWGPALVAVAALVGCGGGSDSVPVVPPATVTVAAAITAASALPANDTSGTDPAANPSTPFLVVQNAGLPAVTVNSPPKVNFAVFSDGKVKTDLVIGDVRFAIAKLIPGTDGNPDQWVSYISNQATAAVGVGPGAGNKAFQATTDSKKSLEELVAAGEAGQLIYNPDGYYTYSFKTDITKVAETNGVVYEPSRTHRVGIQMSYKNAAGETVRVNPYFDFTIVDGKSVPATGAQTRVMANVASCNGCHEKLALHGGGRVDTQYCVMCHNPGTTDPDSGNNLNLSTMVHKIHAGRLLNSKLASGGEDYVIWGYRNTKHDYAEVGFPQDLRNCTVCHSADATKTKNPTPQGDNWKTKVSKEACLTCHANKTGSAWDTSHQSFAAALVGAGAAAKDMTNKQCADCHKVGSNISPEAVHWNQNEENSAKYKMNIESTTFDAAARKVTVKYFLSDPTNGNAAYNLVTSDCTGTTAAPVCSSSTKFGNLRFYLAYQNVVGQSDSVTEYSAYNNGGSSARVDAYKGTNDGSNHYTIEIALPADSATAIAKGTASVVSIGQVKEAQLQVKAMDPRPEVVPKVLVNTLVQNTSRELALTGALLPRRAIVSNEKCNVCHGSLGATSGSNTLSEAFHGGARNTVEACVVCHDANRASSTIMTNGLNLQESYQFKRMIHGIHGNSKRTYPFTHGNSVVGAFNKDGSSATGGAALASGVENYAAEVAWPGVGINCNACHVNNSYKQDLSSLGSTVSPRVTGADPLGYKVISPKAASCTACHDSSAAIGHVATFGGSAFGDKTQAQIAGLPRETCDDCHASGGFKGVDIVHNQK